MELTFLGTSGMVPTKERNHSSVFLEFKGEGIMFDCGEGTQRQLKIAEIKPTKITRILLSHWHGDHVFGLPGLLQTMSSLEQKKLEVYGPKGTMKNMEAMFEAFSFRPDFEFLVNDVEESVFIDAEDFSISALPLDHSVDCIGFRFEEKDRRRINTKKVKDLGIPDGPLLGKLQKGNSITFKGKKYSADDLTYVVKGKSVAYCVDTSLTKNCVVLSEGVDLLISEAVYVEGLREKADDYKHMTAQDAASLASQANVKKLVITHFSQRYKTSEDVENEAKSIFPNTIAAYDFMKVKV